jgi:eukaryotic-like serine/threonine-protein kinase
MIGPNVRPPADLELDAYLEPFEAAAARGDEPDLADYLPPPTHPKYSAVLCELIRLDLEFAWDRGGDRRVEAYAGRFPALFADAGRLAAVAAEEYRLRKAAGEDPDPAEYRARLNVELEGLAAASSAGPVWDGTALPAVGEFVPPGFRIRSELGRGAFGRVYLAEQPDLAGRLVAIKVSSRLVGEAQTLARLQHTHIVPVYAVHRVGGYQLLVMPFLGAATLADLVRTIRGSGTIPATGRAIRTVIASHAGEVLPTMDSAGVSPTPTDALVAVPYTDAILDFGDRPRRRPGPRPRAGHPAPRPEAGQRPAHGRRPADAPRLQSRGRRPIGGADRRRDGPSSPPEKSSTEWKRSSGRNPPTAFGPRTNQRPIERPCRT